MAKVRQDNMVFETDSSGNPVIQTIVVEKVIAVPDTTQPQANRVVAVLGKEDKIALTLFSKNEEITLTGAWKYLGNLVFKKVDFEDDVSSFTATVEYIIEVSSANSECKLKLYNYASKVDIAGSEVNSGIKDVGKCVLESTNLTMPENSIIECWGLKVGGSVSFLSSKITVTKKRI